MYHVSPRYHHSHLGKLRANFQGVSKSHERPMVLRLVMFSVIFLDFLSWNISNKRDQIKFQTFWSFCQTQVSSKPFRFKKNMKSGTWTLKSQMLFPWKSMLFPMGTLGFGLQLHWVSLDIFAGSPWRRVRLSTDLRPGDFFEARCSIPIGSISRPFTDI